MLPQTISTASRLSRWQIFALCAGAIVIPFVLGLAGQSVRKTSAPSLATESFDAGRQLLFVAQPDGSVRVLNLRHTVGEVAALRSPQRNVVQAMSLRADGKELWVRGDDADYRYDTHSLRLIARNPSEHVAMTSAAASR